MAAKLAVMREAMNDPLFLADLQEVAEDFKHVDAEGAAPPSLLYHCAGTEQTWC